MKVQIHRFDGEWKEWGKGINEINKRKEHIINENILTWRLKAGITESERKSIASQRLAKHTFLQQQKSP
jgi:hypothetical protein